MVCRRIVILLALLILSAAAVAQDAVDKCGTFSVIRQLTEGGKLRAETRFAARPSLQKNRLTANGKIRIHYDTAGVHQPAFVTVTYVNSVKTVTRIPNTYEQYIDTVSALFDSVWRAEIDHFGFDVPPADGGAGGGDEYDVYVENIGGGIFGVTTPEDPVGPNRSNRQYTTFIRIDNDFGTGYRTNGIEAILATAAHEFHHAVQIGGAGIWNSQYSFFYELCAEAMEHIVFRHAKDYLFDVRIYFRNISGTSLFQRPVSIETAGYERAVWGIFLVRKFGIDIMRDLWTEIGNREPIAALNAVLHARSTSIEREFANFTYWNFYTAHRADSAAYYPDAKLYPAVALYQTVNANPSIQDISLTAGSFAPYYIKAATNTDSAFLIISNTDLADAVANNQSVFSSKLSVSSVEQSGLTAVSTGVFAKFSAANIENWSYIPIGINTKTFCFPNPFRPDASSLLISLNGIGVSDRVTLSIIEASTLDQVYSSKAEYTPFSGIQYVEWKGRDHNGYIVPSGVYLYILSDGEKIVKGKFAVIR